MIMRFKFSPIPNFCHYENENENGEAKEQSSHRFGFKSCQVANQHVIISFLTETSQCLNNLGIPHPLYPYITYNQVLIYTKMSHSQTEQNVREDYIHNINYLDFCQDLMRIKPTNLIRR